MNAPHAYVFTALGCPLVVVEVAGVRFVSSDMALDKAHELAKKVNAVVKAPPLPVTFLRGEPETWPEDERAGCALYGSLRPTGPGPAWSELPPATRQRWITVAVALECQRRRIAELRELLHGKAEGAGPVLIAADALRGLLRAEPQEREPVEERPRPGEEVYIAGMEWEGYDSIAEVLGPTGEKDMKGRTLWFVTLADADGRYIVSMEDPDWAGMEATPEDEADPTQIDLLAPPADTDGEEDHD